MSAGDDGSNAEVATGPIHAHPLLGVFYMVSASFFFALMAALIRLVSLELHAFEIVFFRNAFAILWMLPWLWRGGIGQLRTGRIGLYMARAVVGVLSMLGFFWGLTAMPLAEAVSLSFAAPLFVTLGAALFLREVVGPRRWSATIVGFIGVLIILRPGITELSTASLVVTVSAAGMAASVLMIKQLSRTESSNAIVTYMVLTMAPLSLIPALFVWQVPTAEAILWMLLLSGCGTAGHLLFTNAMRVADASMVMPFDFVRLLFTATLGYLLFGQAVDAWTWAGGAVIFAAGVYTAHREAKLSRNRRLAPIPEA